MQCVSTLTRSYLHDYASRFLHNDDNNYNNNNIHIASLRARSCKRFNFWRAEQTLPFLLLFPAAHKSEGASECFPLILNSICRITLESRRISRESLSNCLCSLPPKALICTQHNCLIRCMNICTLGFSAFHHSLHTVIPPPSSPTLALPSPLLAKSHHVWMDARTQTRTDSAFISFFATCKLAVLHLNGSH